MQYFIYDKYENPMQQGNDCPFNKWRVDQMSTVKNNHLDSYLNAQKSTSDGLYMSMKR